MDRDITDFRVSSDFPMHRKTRKLIGRLGHKGVYCLIALWSHVAKRKSKGRLEGLSVEDIALEGLWDGDAKEFVDALVYSGYLEKTKDCYLIHDWEIHNPWRYWAKERSERASRIASKMWESASTQHRAAQRPDAQSMRGGCQEVAPPPSPSPSPSPSPTPIPIRRAFEEVWAKYPRKAGKHSSFQSFLSTNPSDHHLLQKALGNYLSSRRVARGYVQDGKRWFAEWRDWIEYKEEGEGPGCRLCGDSGIVTEGRKHRFCTCAKGKERRAKDDRDYSPRG